MQNTPNYSYLLPEGTDIVNPLTQMNPNWTDTDSHLTYLHTRICTYATVAKSGTVFAITRQRENTNLSYPALFRFTAPADYNEGDTFTLDGTARTAMTVDGKPLKDKCFVNNASLIASFANNIIYLYVDSSDAPTASEVTTTGGDSVQDYIDGTIFKNLEAWTPNIGENWETFISRVRDNTTRTQPCNSIRTTVDGISGLIFRQSRRTASNNWIYEAFYTTAAGAVLYTISASPSAAYVRKYNLTSGTVENLSTADAQALQFYGLDV